MTNRETKAEKQAVVAPVYVLDTEAAMQEIFAKYVQTDLDKLFNVLKMVADEARNSVMRASSNYLNSRLRRVYVEPLYKEFSKFSVHYFRSDIDTKSFDKVEFLTSDDDDYFGVGKDEDGYTFVRIWYSNAYEALFYNKKYKTDYVNTTISAIKQFEQVTESVLAFEKQFAEVRATYENDKKLAALAKSKLSDDELTALSRLDIWMETDLSYR